MKNSFRSAPPLDRDPPGNDNSPESITGCRGLAGSSSSARNRLSVRSARYSGYALEKNIRYVYINRNFRS